MKLPALKIRLVPEGVCIRCAQHGYVDEKAQLCCGCLNISLLKYARRKLAGAAERQTPVPGRCCR